MLIGRFDVTGRPYIEGQISIPRLGLRANISFLVDTGADFTTLAPQHAQAMGINYSLLDESPRVVVGIGGESRPYRTPAEVMFDDGHVLHRYEITLYILRGEAAPLGIPSLLGRDVLQHWVMSYSPPTNELTFVVYPSA